MMIESRCKRLTPVLFLTPSGHRNHQEVRSPGLCANLPAGIETTQSGHSDIQHDKIRPKLLDGANRGSPVILGAGRVARNLQDQREAVGTVLVIVNDEDPKT